MYEYEVVNTITGEHNIVCGDSYPLAMLKAGLNPKDHVKLLTEYIGGYDWTLDI